MFEKENRFFTITVLIIIFGLIILYFVRLQTYKDADNLNMYIQDDVILSIDGLNKWENEVIVDKINSDEKKGLRNVYQDFVQVGIDDQGVIRRARVDDRILANMKKMVYANTNSNEVYYITSLDYVTIPKYQIIESIKTIHTSNLSKDTENSKAFIVLTNEQNELKYIELVDLASSNDNEFEIKINRLEGYKALGIIIYEKASIVNKSQINYDYPAVFDYNVLFNDTYYDCCK